MLITAYIVEMSILYKDSLYYYIIIIITNRIPFVFDFFDILQSESIVDATEKDLLIQEILNSKKTNSAVLVIQPLIALMKDQLRSYGAEANQSLQINTQ